MSPYIFIRTAFPSRIVKTIANSHVTVAPLAIPLPV